MGATTLYRRQQPEAALKYYENRALPLFREGQSLERSSPGY